MTAVERVRQHLPQGEAWRQLPTALLFLLPAMIGFVVFYLRPTIIGFYNSFTDKELLRPTSEFVGLENYRQMLGDEVFWNALRVTLEYVVINIGLQTIVAILIAWVLQRLQQLNWLRTVMLTPWLLSNVVVALLFLWILDFRLGIANNLLGNLGVQPIPWFGSEEWVIPSVALINVWRHMGYTALLIFAGLQTIPNNVMEAARVDGANEFRRFWHVTLPLLRPVLAVVLVITMIGSFQIYDTIDVTTQGGPVNASRVIYVYIFDQAFARRNFGYASAMAVALFLILAAVTFIQLRLLRADESDLA